MKLLIAVSSTVLADCLASSLPRYDIHICHTGPDALTLLETLQPEVLLLDLSLPVIDGLTLLSKSSYKPMHILALTNFASTAVLQAAAKVGIQHIILLPCSLRSIIGHLDALTEKAPSAGA